MERQPSGADARQTLQDLASDREALAGRLIAPWWTYPLFALIAAAYVATPAVQPDSRSLVVGCLTGAFVLLAGSYHRLSGVRVGRIGVRGGAVLATLVLVVQVSLSAANGLAASLTGWWVLAPAAASFVLVLVGARWFDRLYRENLRRGR
jgi:hypothetical protein